MSDSVRPHRRQPTRLPRHWDSPGKNTGVGCRFLLQCMRVKSESEIAQSYPTLCDPMDCSLPGSSIHGSLQARVLVWVVIAFSELNKLGGLKPQNCSFSHFRSQKTKIEVSGRAALPWGGGAQREMAFSPLQASSGYGQSLCLHHSRLCLILSDPLFCMSSLCLL